jgi:peptidoglycan/LPS O-acetylase OafA/YrhL
MAWCVFVHHTDIARNWSRTGAWSCDSELVLFLGKGAVMVFFMITGFLFWEKAVQAGGKMSPFPFWLKRLKRLAPLYTLSAVIVFILVAKWWIAAPTATRLEFAGRLFGLGFLNWSRLPGFQLITANAGVQWSLWYEWRFYLALPLLAWFVPGRRILLLCCTCLLVLVLTGFTHETIFWLAFLPGIAAVYFVRHPALHRTLGTPAAATVALCWCAGVLGLSHASGYGWSLVAVVPLFWTVAAGNTYWGALVHGATRVLGTISYSVYLLHGIVLLAILKAAGRVINLAELSLPVYCCLMAATAILIVAICSVTYRYVEHPFMTARTSKQKANRSGTSRLVQEPLAHAN